MFLIRFFAHSAGIGSLRFCRWCCMLLPPQGSRVSYIKLVQDDSTFGPRGGGGVGGCKKQQVWRGSLETWYFGWLFFLFVASSFFSTSSLLRSLPPPPPAYLHTSLNILLIILSHVITSILYFSLSPLSHFFPLCPTLSPHPSFPTFIYNFPSTISPSSFTYISLSLSFLPSPTRLLHSSLILAVHVPNVPSCTKHLSLATTTLHMVFFLRVDLENQSRECTATDRRSCICKGKIFPRCVIVVWITPH